MGAVMLLKTDNSHVRFKPQAIEGLAAVVPGEGARDWMENEAFDQVQYKELGVDIHHVFRQRWCSEHQIDDERRESVVNTIAISARTNRTIGGDAPSQPKVIEQRAQLESDALDRLVSKHLVSSTRLRAAECDAYSVERREALSQLVERAISRPVQSDTDQGQATEGSKKLEQEDMVDIVASADF